MKYNISKRECSNMHADMGYDAGRWGMPYRPPTHSAECLDGVWTVNDLESIYHEAFKRGKTDGRRF